FPPLWSEPLWSSAGHWAPSRIARVLDHGEAVITFSSHVARKQVQQNFGIAAAKVVVIPHAPPDLSSLLPFVSQRKSTAASRRQAADILRKHSADRDWAYLRGFPFEDVPYLVISAQDRTSKNIWIATEAGRELLRKYRINIKI